MPKDLPAELDPFLAEHRDDPFPAYRRLRESAPVAHHPKLQMWLVSRHHDCMAVLKSGDFGKDFRNCRDYQPTAHSEDIPPSYSISCGCAVIGSYSRIPRAHPTAWGSGAGIRETANRRIDGPGEGPGPRAPRSPRRAKRCRPCGRLHLAVPPRGDRRPPQPPRPRSSDLGGVVDRDAAFHRAWGQPRDFSARQRREPSLRSCDPQEPLSGRRW